MQAILGIVLKVLLQEVFSFLKDFLEKLQRDKTNQELGGAVNAGQVLIEGTKLNTELDNAEKRAAALSRAELLKRLREHGGLPAR